MAAGAGAVLVIGTALGGAYVWARTPAAPAPVETVAPGGPLWRAAEASYRAVAPSGSASLVMTAAIRRWARSPGAVADLLDAFDVPLEDIGHFQNYAGVGSVPASDAALLANMAAADPGPTARSVLVGLLALGDPPKNLGPAAKALFPGPSGLSVLLGDLAPSGPYLAAVPTLLRDYGLSGPAGIAYVRAHPADTALTTALADTTTTAPSAKALWSVLKTSAGQLAFLAAFPYTEPPAAPTLMRTARPYPEEVLLEAQYEAESQSHPTASLRPVLADLNRIVNRYGFVRTATGVPLAVMTAAVQEDPSGYLARSVRAYAQVRHAPYFGLERCHGSYACWPYSYGRVQYDPTRGIREWPTFLKAYAQAPGANDGAYRLGRDEELLGQYASAVQTFNRGLSLPSGGTAYDLAAREVWVLDTEMSPAELTSMAASLPANDKVLRLRVLYTLGVDELRAGDYSGASATLQGVANAIGSGTLVPDASGQSWPFAVAVRIQALQASELATLSQDARSARTAASRATYEYDIAAFMYHRTLLFYNQLWAGSEQSYGFLGYQPPVADASFVRYEEGENNFVQAAARFQALANSAAVPASIRARALFSYGMSLYDLEGYGADASVLASPSVLANRIARAFGTFARTYPGSPLAPGALTLEAAFTQDRGLLKTLVQRYGSTPAGRDAKTDLVQKNWPATQPTTVGDLLAARQIDTTTPGVPARVLAWAAAPGPVVAVRVVGPVTYIRVRPTTLSPGQWPQIDEVIDAGLGRIQVVWTTGPLNVGVAKPAPLFHGFALTEVIGRETLASSGS